ncbi:MAG: hypothetical protein LC109_07770 [Bacteroidia bacterium]|nr:hypothetical protein [Bacteroidia bacterium]
MKKTTILFLSVFLILSCKKDKNPEEVRAGVVSKGMVHKEFEPQILAYYTLDDKFSTCQVDCNMDGTVDLSFSISNTSSGINTIARLDNHPSNKFSICLTDTNYSLRNYPNIPAYIYYTGLVKRLEYKEIINERTGVWSPMDSTFNNVRLLFGQLLMANLGSVTGEWENSMNKYIGIRYIEDNDTLYGWLQVSLSGVNEKLILYDCAFQRR